MFLQFKWHVWRKEGMLCWWSEWMMQLSTKIRTCLPLCSDSPVLHACVWSGPEGKVICLSSWVTHQDHFSCMCVCGLSFCVFSPPVCVCVVGGWGWGGMAADVVIETREGGAAGQSGAEWLQPFSRVSLLFQVFMVVLTWWRKGEEERKWELVAVCRWFRMC